MDDKEIIEALVRIRERAKDIAVFAQTNIAHPNIRAMNELTPAALICVEDFLLLCQKVFPIKLSEFEGVKEAMIRGENHG